MSSDFPPPHALRMNLIGCGRVGQTLAHLWQQSGCVQAAGLHSRSATSAQAAQTFVGAGRVVQLADLPPAEIWLIAVPDTAIETVARQLADTLRNDTSNSSTHQSATAPIALHCSGFLTSAALSPLSALGWRTSSTHPVRSFADPALSARSFAGTPVAIEGDADACAAAHRLFEAVGARCFAIDGTSKPLYHAAAVFANNFCTVLQGVAQDLWQHCGIAPDMARELDIALLSSTLANLRCNTPAQALTGPAARGDIAVVQAQGQAVAQWDAMAGELYALMSEMARTLKARA